jgi:hypothetical protein
MECHCEFSYKLSIQLANCSIPTKTPLALHLTGREVEQKKYVCSPSLRRTSCPDVPLFLHDRFGDLIMISGELFVAFVCLICASRTRHTTICKILSIAFCRVFEQRRRRRINQFSARNALHHSILCIEQGKPFTLLGFPSNITSIQRNSQEYRNEKLPQNNRAFNLVFSEQPGTK